VLSRRAKQRQCGSREIGRRYSVDAHIPLLLRLRRHDTGDEARNSPPSASLSRCYIYCCRNGVHQRFGSLFRRTAGDVQHGHHVAFTYIRTRSRSDVALHTVVVFNFS